MFDILLVFRICNLKFSRIRSQVGPTARATALARAPAAPTPQDAAALGGESHVRPRPPRRRRRRLRARRTAVGARRPPPRHPVRPPRRAPAGLAPHRVAARAARVADRRRRAQRLLPRAAAAGARALHQLRGVARDAHGDGRAGVARRGRALPRVGVVQRRGRRGVDRARDRGAERPPVAACISRVPLARQAPPVGCSVRVERHLTIAYIHTARARARD